MLSGCNWHRLAAGPNQSSCVYLNTLKLNSILKTAITITTTTTILLAKEEIYIVDNTVYMMAGCQLGRSPSMLAAHNCI